MNAGQGSWLVEQGSGANDPMRIGDRRITDHCGTQHCQRQKDDFLYHVCLPPDGEVLAGARIGYVSG